MLMANGHACAIIKYNSMFDQNSVKCIEYLYLLTLFKSTQYVVPEAKKFFL